MKCAAHIIGLFSRAQLNGTSRSVTRWRHSPYDVWCGVGLLRNSTVRMDVRNELLVGSRTPLPVAPKWSASGDEEVGGSGGGVSTGVITETKPKTKKPSMYKVLMLNDDYTPMEFVVMVLERFFNKTHEEATHIMLHVHQKGVGVCGVYTYEVAETKVNQVMDFARRHQHPLQCTLEKE